MMKIVFDKIRIYLNLIFGFLKLKSFLVDLHEKQVSRLEIMRNENFVGDEIRSGHQTAY